MKKINKLLLELYRDRKQIIFLCFLAYVCYLLQDLVPSESDLMLASGLYIGLGSLALSATGMFLGNKSANDANDIAKENQALTAQIAKEQLAFQKQEQAKLNAQKDKYRRMEFKNPYAEIENPFAGMENVFEDLKVDTLAAEFQAEQGMQQRANIMQGLRGAAGGSGIAGLAQSLASQGQLQTQQISAGIGQQEAANQRMRAQGAQQVQQMERQGESATQMAKLGGEQLLQTMEMDRQATLLGIQMGQSAGANAALQQAYSNQLSAGAAQASLYGTQAAGMYGMAGQALGAGITSLYNYGSGNTPTGGNPVGDTP